MKLTNNNNQDFAAWEEGRSVKARLTGIIRQLNTIKKHYKEDGIPPQPALHDEFSFRVYLLFGRTFDNELVELACRIANNGDYIRKRAMYPNNVVYPGSSILQMTIDKFEADLAELEKALKDKLEAVEANMRG